MAGYLRELKELLIKAGCVYVLKNFFEIWRTETRPIA
jgi:hypothetical protein